MHSRTKNWKCDIGKPDPQLLKGTPIREEPHSEFPFSNLKLFLFAIIVIYSAAMTIFSYLRFLNFYTSNWDLGIEMQMLSTNFHHAILFETADLESYGTISQLEIHSSYIALPYSLLYQVFNSPLFLFATQSVVFSASIVPISLIAKKIGLSGRGLIFVLTLYLLNFPLIASQFYDFHFESFLPLEFFALFLLVMERRLYSSMAVILLGSMTMEVFPFLSLGILLYFFYDRGLPKLDKLSSFLESKYRDIYALGIFALVMFVVLKVLQIYVIPTALNNVSGMQYMLSLHRESLIPVSFNALQSIGALGYWLILYVSVGFIPLFYKRHFLLSIPWIYETVFLQPNYATPVDQYNFIAMLGLVIGVVFALREKEKSGSDARFLLVPATTAVCGIAVLAVNGFQFTHVLWSRLPFSIAACIVISVLVWLLASGRGGKLLKYDINRMSPKKVLASVLLLLLAMGVLFSPFSLIADSHAFDNGYSFGYSFNPEYSGAVTVAGMIPGNASVIASDNLFPFVDTNPNAYSFFYKPLDNLSYTTYYNFSSDFNFQYVFIDQAQFKDIPAVDMQYINGSYGLLAEVNTDLSYPGNIYLYELHYSGPVEMRNVNV